MVKIRYEFWLLEWGPTYSLEYVFKTVRTLSWRKNETYICQAGTGPWAAGGRRELSCDRVIADTDGPGTGERRGGSKTEDAKAPRCLARHHSQILDTNM